MSSASGPMTFVLLVAAVGLYFAPEGTATNVRSAVGAALGPGQAIARQTSIKIQDNLRGQAIQSERTQSRVVEELKRQVTLEQEQSAALRLQLARLNDERARDVSTPDQLRSLPRLVSSSLIEADVLGDAVAESWRAGKLLNRGETHGVREASLVVQSRHPLVDLGRDAGLSPEDTLLLGRCVIGKVERVGRWTSTFVLLTDAEYRGRAQLVHQTETGFVFGSKGILKGQGSPLCRLEGIDANDGVAIGDAIYTTNRDGLLSTPLYYGRVTEATLGPDAKEWSVLVEPVPIPHNLASVQILRTSVNPERLSAGL